MSLRRKIVWFGQESLQWTLLLGLVPVFIALGLVFSKSRSGILVLVLTTVLAAAAASSWREFSDEDGAGRGAGAARGRGRAAGAASGGSSASWPPWSWPRRCGSASVPSSPGSPRSTSRPTPAGPSTRTPSSSSAISRWPGRARGPTSTPIRCTRRSTTGCGCPSPTTTISNTRPRTVSSPVERSSPPASGWPSGWARCGGGAGARSPRASAWAPVSPSRPSSSTASPTSTSRSRPTRSIS